MQTGWVKPPRPITGLDHLGTQSPCALIYSQLLPGITNVTDRARYYSLYPWIIRSLDRRYEDSPIEFYVDRYRRADCLLTLVTERHARKIGEERLGHGEGMIGRLQLVPALTKLEHGEQLMLSIYATRADDVKERYFQNRLGGLGQYYAGQLAELRILDTSGGSWVTYTQEAGTPLAGTLDEQPGADLFWQIVDADQVTLQNLDDLKSFCICGLRNHEPERSQLLDLFFAKTPFYAQRTASGRYDPAFRRDSLRLLLHLADAFGRTNQTRITEDSFRAAVYTGSLSEGLAEQLPQELLEIRALWSIYERSDLLSMAFLAVFSAALHALDAATRLGQIFHSAEQFAAHLSRQPAITNCIRSLLENTDSSISSPEATFSTLIAHLLLAHPELENWQDSDHEINLAAALLSKPATIDTYPQSLVAGLRVLALLAGRETSFPLGYGDLVLTASELENYPINLISFSKRVERWRTLSLQSVVEDLVLWSLNTHLTVALRKLREARQSSFHLQPSESGLKTVGTIPPPVSTLPRVWQALQILADLGTLVLIQPPTPDGKPGLEITSLGRSILECAHG